MEGGSIRLSSQDMVNISVKQGRYKKGHNKWVRMYSFYILLYNIIIYFS